MADDTPLSAPIEGESERAEKPTDSERKSDVTASDKPTGKYWLADAI